MRLMAPEYSMQGRGYVSYARILPVPVITGLRNTTPYSISFLTKDKDVHH